MTGYSEYTAPTSMKARYSAPETKAEYLLPALLEDEDPDQAGKYQHRNCISNRQRVVVGKQSWDESRAWQTG